MNETILRAITGLILITTLGLVYLFLPPLYFSLLLAVILLEIVVIEWPRLFSVKSLTFWLLMPLYPIAPFAILIWLNQQPTYHHLVFWIFALAFSLDTFSYIVGKSIGKHKICPRISPGKSWEGFVGGVVGTSTVMRLLLLNKHFTWPEWLQFFGFIFIACAVALLGDFFKSIFKRRAHIKDAGFLLPGHGGFLDRFDGIMFAGVLFYLLRDWLLKFF